MNFMPFSGAGSNPAAGLPSPGYAPPVYDKLLSLIRERTFTDSLGIPPPGALRADKTGTFGYVFTLEPLIKSLPLKQGRDLITQFPQTKDLFMAPNLYRYVQVGSTREQRRISRFDLDGISLTSGEKDLAIVRFQQAMAKIESECSPLNTGALTAGDIDVGYGGAKTGSIMIGSPVRPVALGADKDDVRAFSAPLKSTAIEFVVNLGDVLSEQIGGDGDIASTYDGQTLWDQQLSTESYFLCDGRLATMAKLSDKAISATSQTNYQNALFGDYTWMKAFGVWDKFHKSNLVPMSISPSNTGDGNIVAGKKVYRVFFGQRRSMMIAPPFMDSRRKVQDQKNLLEVSTDWWKYDFFVPFPAFCGVAYYTIGDYAVNG